MLIGTIFITKAQNQNNMNIQSNPNAPVKFSKSIQINSSAKKVWAVLTDINNWDKWQPEISKPKLNDELKEQSKFVWKTGGIKIHSTLHTVKPYEALGWTGHTFGLFAIHNWQIMEKDGITMVIVNESMEGLLAGLFKKSFNKNLDTGMQHWLEALKKECEK